MATNRDEPAPSRDEEIALLASASDRALIANLGFARTIEVTPEALCSAIRSGDLVTAIVSGDFLKEEFVGAIEAALAEQPYWSNFPFILLAGALAPDDSRIERLRNVALIPAPADPDLISHAIKVSQGSRRRQWGAGFRHQQLIHAEEQYHQLAVTLEAQVRARTLDLRTANERLLREIDERREADQRLRESEELYRYTAELSQQFVWIAKPDGRIIPISAGFNRMTGLSDDGDVGGGWLRAIHPDDQSELLAVWAGIRQQRAPGSTEFRLRMSDGGYRTFRAKVAPRFDKAGNIILWYGFAEDVEREKLAEAARIEAEERYQLAARATRDAIWDLDLVDGSIHWSESSMETLGHPHEKSSSTSLKWWDERVHPDDRAAAVDTLDATIAGGGSRWTATYRFRRADGEYATFFDRGFVLRDAEGRAVRAVGAMADISEREAAAEEIRRMQAELVHVSRLSAMGTMASTLAHEINQPLTAVANYVRGSRRMLDSDTADLDEVRSGLEAAERSALLAGQIVRRLRDLVARRNAQVRVEDIAKLIEEAGVLGFLDAHVQGVARRTEIDPEARWVEVDPVQIQQVLINLIRNAVQAMQDAATREITIATRRVSENSLEISVADTGMGLSADVKDALFSPFVSSKEEGLGIGLSISRTIIEAHGGKIWAEDRKGGGTVFRFTLPLTTEPVSADAAAIS